MRTTEQKLSTKLRKAAERTAHHERVWRKHPRHCPLRESAFQKGQETSAQNSRQTKTWLAITKPYLSQVGLFS
jgi:hypothetical protein